MNPFSLHASKVPEVILYPVDLYSESNRLSQKEDFFLQKDLRKEDFFFYKRKFFLFFYEWNIFFFFF